MRDAGGPRGAVRARDGLGLALGHQLLGGARWVPRRSNRRQDQRAAPQLRPAARLLDAHRLLRSHWSVKKTISSPQLARGGGVVRKWST